MLGEELKPLFNEGLAIGLIAVIVLFLWRSLWPWFKDVYWPSRERFADRQQATIDKIQEAIVTIQGVLVGEKQERNEVQWKLGELNTKSDVIILMLHRLGGGIPADFSTLISQDRHPDNPRNQAAAEKPAGGETNQNNV